MDAHGAARPLEDDRRRYLRQRPAGTLEVRIAGVDDPFVVGLSPAGMRTVSATGLDEADGEGEAVDITLIASGEEFRVRGRLVWHEILLTPRGRRFVSGVEFVEVPPAAAQRLQGLESHAGPEWRVGEDGV